MTSALAVATFLALFARPSTALADGPPLDGPWNMTALTENYTVQQWAAACGAAPVSDTLLPGGPATVHAEGPELAVTAGRRTIRTDRCLDPLPTLSPDSHTTDGSSWRTRCSTPTNDPRRAVVNAAYFLTSDGSLSLAETGRYEFTINGARCIADVKRAASLRRVVAAPVASADVPAPAPTAVAPSPAATTPSRAAPSNPCSSPGNPARLEVRPSRKLLRLGDDYAFRAVVLDENGCFTGTPIQWTIASLRFQDGQSHSTVPTIDSAGKLSIPSGPSADFTDATFEVVATAAGRSAKASVQATSAANYEAMLAQSGLGPKGERDEPSVAILATGSIGASDVRAEDGARHRRTVFIAVIGALTLVLGVVAAIGLRRARRGKMFEQAAEERHAERLREYEEQKREREEKHAAQMRAHIESVKRAQEASAAMAAARAGNTGPVFCPSCRREFPGATTYCPFDSNRLVAVAGHENMMIGPAGGICPTCKRGFNPGVKVCPHDGDELVPQAMANPPGGGGAGANQGAGAAPPRGKICPTCGGRFDGVAAFCGKDGTQLVLLN